VGLFVVSGLIACFVHDKLLTGAGGDTNMTSTPKRDTDETAFRIGPLAVVLIGMLAFSPLVTGFWHFCSFVAWHYSDRFGSLLFNFGTLILVAAYLGVVITGVVLLRGKNREGRKQR
jgi:hypothetical protein